MAAQKVVRKQVATALVNARNREILRYLVRARGPHPTFAIGDSKANLILLSNNDPTTDGDTWERVWPQPLDRTLPMTEHSVGFSFLDAMEYTFILEHHGPNGLIETLFEVNYASEGFESAEFLSLSVITF